jgi:hypothetical protein
MAWPHMHKKRPQAIGWRRFNLMHNIKEKMSKVILKDGMINQVKN